MDVNTLMPLISQVTMALTVVVAVLIITRRISTDMRPIVKGMVEGVAKNATSNAMLYAIAILFGLSASLSAFWDVFHTMDSQSLRLMSWHQYFAQWAKVLNPFIVAFLARIIPSNAGTGGPGNVTAPPFPVPDKPVGT